MMRVRARGALALKDNRFDEVIRLVEEGLEEIRLFYREHDRQDLLDNSGELQSLELWLEEIHHKRPMSAREKLETALNEAVKNEDYEEAARVRDALRKME
jgi:excinuclease UvrABC helicase subunit UvrB